LADANGHLEEAATRKVSAVEPMAHC
jgi:hypothetical protein